MKKRKEWIPIQFRSGFIADESYHEMYEHLPILVVYLYEGIYPAIDYVDEGNWYDSIADFSKEACKCWMPCEELEIIEEEEL